MRFILLTMAFCFTLRTANAASFTDIERARLVSYWNAPGRYRVEASADAKKGPWVARLTPEASQWLYAYSHLHNAEKTPPTETTKVTSPQNENWEQWVTAKLAYDRWWAQTIADAANAQVAASAPTPLNAGSAAPPLPGLIPATLLEAAGNPPALAAAVAPLRYTVTFEDGSSIVYNDHVVSRPRYEYYRFAQGVMHPGIALSKVSNEELNSLFAETGMTPFEQHVVKAISRLEGGFESVNTYDTGYLSVGFIQFATLQGGAGSLGDVLKQEKANRPTDFSADFHIYGLDVNPDAALVVIDPVSGAELVGSQAVLKIIDDKRLTAVLQRAGARSRAFRIAQILVAKSNYYPAAMPLEITLGNRVVTGKVADVIKSEAGMATLFDRKVNTGSIRRLSTALEQIMTEHHLTRLEDATAYERDLIKATKWRTDFLTDKNLSQPAN